MKIARFRYARLRVPLITPFKTALREVDHSDDLVLMIDTDDGRTGYGSAPATARITGDTHGAILDAWRLHLEPLLRGRDIADLNRLVADLHEALMHNSSAKAAVEIALYDLFAQSHDVPLYRILGGGPSELRTDLTISVDHADKMIADCEDAIARGFDALKIKVGRQPDEDIERIRAVNAAVAGRASLRLDVNQGWSSRHTVQMLESLEAEGIELELVEQPVKAGDLGGMAFIAARVRTPLMADESVFVAKDVVRLVERRAADIVNIKLMKAGGISRALRIADLCEELGLTCMMGCMLEGPIGVAAAAHVASARSQVIDKIDLDGPALSRFNPVHSNVDFDGPRIVLGDAPGLGITRIDGLEMLDAN